MAFRIVFLGTPAFAAVSLKRLLESQATIAGVVTAPDRPRGRAMHLQPTPVRALADQAGIPVLTPSDVNVPEAVAAIRAWSPNVIVVVAFGQILKEFILEMPPLGCINVHPSLLPAYRGAAPMQRALMDGKTETGMTICRMVRKLDAGDILLQERAAIRPEDNFGALHDRLAIMGADLLLEALKSLAAGREQGRPQDDTIVTHAPKISAQEEWISWDKPARQIVDLLRALDPAPGARALLARAGKSVEVKIWRATAEDRNAAQAAPGDIVEISHAGLRVATGKGILSIQEIQSASKSRMHVAQWLQGHTMVQGDRFENPAK